MEAKIVWLLFSLSAPKKIIGIALRLERCFGGGQAKKIALQLASCSVDDALVVYIFSFTNTRT